MPKSSRGFTLIEILLVIGLIAILAAIVIIAINPARQFAQARNTQRVANVNAILNAVHQNMVDNKGVWTCTTSLPTTATTIEDGTGGDICDCIVPTYVAEMPYDPATGTWTSCSDYYTGYSIVQNSSGRVTVSAIEAELGESISVTR